MKNLKVYKTSEGIVVENNSVFYRQYTQNWKEFINNEALIHDADTIFLEENIVDFSSMKILPPIGKNQELWACGVTYLSSKHGRLAESKIGGGGDFYAKVYEAERPEVFFKSNPFRISGHNDFVRIRKDSTWDVPEPELTLVVNPKGKIVGYTIGNDMSSRSIEGENPLYLPQAKTYDGCAALGPCILISDETLENNCTIQLSIVRNSLLVFNESIHVSAMKRSFEELISYVYRECSFPNGCCIMTGTGIVPDNDFTLQSGDIIHISIDKIGTLTNIVK